MSSSFTAGRWRKTPGSRPQPGRCSARGFVAGTRLVQGREAAREPLSLAALTLLTVSGHLPQLLPSPALGTFGWFGQIDRAAGLFCNRANGASRWLSLERAWPRPV